MVPWGKETQLSIAIDSHSPSSWFLFQDHLGLNPSNFLLAEMSHVIQWLDNEQTNQQNMLILPLAQET